ncbi:MAG: sterol desaturase family protein [Gallionellaceae bacterium]|nr:sterol desaturase family protein [Gallionellaceae bacterium]
MEKMIVYAFPVFGLMIMAEYAYGRARGRNTYRINDAISNLSQGILSQITLVFTGIFQIGIYTLVYSKVALFNGGFWSNWYGWLAAMLLVDFCGYWHHRYSHETGILWAAHVVHHQSQDFNFATALRQESAYPILGWIFYLPMALLGVPPEIFAASGLVVLLYQIWIHTEHVGKLGWFDRIFSSPSNHRVHHAVNDAYIDKNYGGMLIIWDRLFGTFIEEGKEPCIYGTRPQFESWDPVLANLVVYRNLARDAWRSRFPDKLRIWFMPPGWRPDDVAQRFPEPKFDLSEVRLFDPPMSHAVAWFGGVQFLLLVLASGALLWYSDVLSWAALSMLVAAITAGLWATGRVMEGRMSLSSALFLDAAISASALAVL